ncbi:MAG: T9SS type A sorting domain-containing protein [Flavobacteriaceae bacterium]
MKTFLLLSFVLLSFFSFSQTHVWNGNGGDNQWFNASNWDAGTVPNASSTVLIENAAVNILSSSATASSIDLASSATLTISNNFTVSGVVNISESSTVIISQGTLSGVTFQNFGLLQFETLDQKHLNNVTINNHYTMAVVTSGVIHLDNTTTINNFETGTISIDSNGGIVEDSGTATLNNEGVIQKMGNSPGAFYMIFDTNNHGSIEVEADQTFLFLVASQNFTNFQDGILTGEGAFDITANFVNHGFINPSGDEITGTLEIVNNFNFPSFATLVIDVNSASEYDVLDVFGSPLIEGNLDVNLLSELNLNDELTVITSSNPLSCNLPTKMTAFFKEGTYFFDVICTSNEVTLKVSDIVFLSVNNFVANNHLLIASPNPSKDVLTFNIPASALQKYLTLSIEVVNIFGQKVAEFPLNDIETVFNVSRFSSGIYFANLVSEKGILATTKLLVE